MTANLTGFDIARIMRLALPARALSLQAIGINAKDLLRVMDEYVEQAHTIASLRKDNDLAHRWLAEAAEALGEVRASDGAPYALEQARVLELIRELRASVEQQDERHAVELGALDTEARHLRVELEAARVAVDDATQAVLDAAAELCLARTEAALLREQLP